MNPLPPASTPDSAMAGHKRHPKSGCAHQLLTLIAAMFLTLIVTILAACLGGVIAETINAMTAGGPYGRLGRGAFSPDVAGFLGSAVGGSIGLVASLVTVILYRVRSRK